MLMSISSAPFEKRGKLCEKQLLQSARAGKKEKKFRLKKTTTRIQTPVVNKGRTVITNLPMRKETKAVQNARKMNRLAKTKNQRMWRTPVKTLPERRYQSTRHRL